MRKILIIIIAVIIIAVFAVNLTGFWPFLNRPINYLVAGAPDKSCQADSDCKIKPTQCGYCGDCGDAVNKNWQQYCPFKSHYFIVYCKTCPPYFARCVEGQCQKYIKKQIFDFESCVAAGNPVMESFPRQCRSDDGQLFVEVIIENLNDSTQRACTQEAKLCPDGSAVGRTGPNCEFAPCPGD